MTDWPGDENVRGATQRGLSLARQAIDGLVVVVFFALLGVAALPMGANRDWAWAPFCVLFGLVSIYVALGVGPRGGGRLAPTERVPLLILAGCFIFFVVFSLWQMTSFAPASGGSWLYSRASEIVGSADRAVPAIARDEARNSLLKCVACGLIFLMARAICRDRRAARLLLKTLAASGSVVVGYGLLMQVSAHSCYLGSYLRKQYEYSASDDFCLMGGTFVSSNSFACYVGMALVAVIALIFSEGGRPTGVGRGPDDGAGGRFLDWLTGARTAQMSAALLLLGGLLLSASRAGLAATVVGGAVLGFLMMRGLWRSRPDLARIFVAGLAFVLVVGLISGGALINKAAAGGGGTGRVEIWLTALQAVGLSPWLGWGLGGFGDIYTILQPARILQPNDIAHSTPLETIVELGVLASIPAIAIVLLPWSLCLRGALRRRRRYRYLPAAAFAVAAVAILHSTVDFSLQIPAIAFVTSAILGMGWAQAFGHRESVPLPMRL